MNSAHVPFPQPIHASRQIQTLLHLRKAATLVARECFLAEYDSQWSGMNSIAGKVGCTAESLHKWVRRAEQDPADRPWANISLAKSANRVSKPIYPCFQVPTINSNRHAAPIDNAFNNSAFEWVIELPSANDRRTANALRCCSTAKAWHAAYRVSPPVHGIDWSMFCGEALAIRYMGRSGGMPSAKKKGTSAGLLNKRLKYFGSIRM
jgi:hypothetical protein